MPKVEAEFLDGKRVLFSARGRTTVNAREALPDGPIGYSSGELLLIALAGKSCGSTKMIPKTASTASKNI